MGGDTIITTTLRMCTNLIKIELFDCNITGEQLLQMVEAVRGHRSLAILDLESNRIGNAGCEVLDTLLHDPSCNLQILDLRRNNIDNEGATILANGLANNTKLKSLILYNNQIDQSVQDVFSKLLCNVSSINSMHSSNHTLEELGLPQGLPQPLLLLKLNKGGGEHDLKALPYVVAWFERAGEAVAGDRESYNIGERKLSAIYQFARAMPLMFVPVSQVKGGDHKRKRGYEVRE